MKLQPEHVEGARGMLKMSRAELAEAAGVTEQTIWLFENNKTTPKEETLFRLQTALEQRGIIFTNGDRPGVTLDKSRAARS